MTSLQRVYNYPWSGRLGRIAKACLCCGDDGSLFQLSSFGASCLRSECRGGEPQPDLLVEYLAEYERLAREWCRENSMDYDTVVQEFEEKYGGPPGQ